MSNTVLRDASASKKIPHPSLHAFVGILKERGWRGQFDAREEEEGLL